MRIRLFWKILFGFWLTFICISQGVWLIFHLYEQPRHRPWLVEYVRQQAEVRLEAAATVLRLGGEKELLALVDGWPEQERKGFSWHFGNETAKPDYPVFTKQGVLPDGATCTLQYDGTSALPHPPRSGWFNMPPELVILGILGGLLFSALLAWYLIKPVWRLRLGFDQLTKGQLGIRLKPLMGRRRDEIADLARDFDTMAERMQTLVESREQLLYDVSHELRSPLARQHMAFGLARQNPQRMPQLLDRIEKESSRMDELVGELLTLSRVEFGADMPEEYFDIGSLARVVVDNAAFEAREDGVEVVLHMAPDEEETGTTACGEAELIRRALENVVRNGVRHSPRGTSVRVTVTRDMGSDSCRIRIADSGPGVPEKDLGKIFEPFVRLGNTSGSGAGLGLAIAKRAVTVHGGTIQAINGPNGGLQITITLPLSTLEMAEDDTK
ncbi:HAMP domain-containing sensor histidine kinase [Pseudodesulfovibrio sp.]|uniref:HAMP domain-containing sensor histidine kinase n=1 Tax=unclassified Pseudodesulfovibrio TaxID=2661612 RepID=UPI003B00A90D